VIAAAALGMIPLFVREGSIIPRGDIVKLNNNWDANWEPKLRVEVFPSAKQASEFSYFTGSATQTIKSVPRSGGLTIEFDDLGTNGTLEIHCRKAAQIKKNGATLRAGSDYHFDGQSGTLTVTFRGATHLEIDGAETFFK
jgi:alpha-glucosidase (family GH31 glycosyl hydrolase)